MAPYSACLSKTGKRLRHSSPFGDNTLDPMSKARGLRAFYAQQREVAGVGERARESVRGRVLAGVVG
jgi:hypothetical protein